MQPTSAPIRVALADDSLLIREAVSQLLRGMPGIELVAVCADADALWRAVEEARPHVVVTDIRMPPGGDDEGIRFATRAREAHPDVGVVVLSQYSEPAYGAALMQGGASGRAYLLKERISDRAELQSAIEVTARGGTLIDPEIIGRMLAHSGPSDSDPLAQLTPRELDVLGQMAEGKSNAAIAEALVLTKHAVEKHIGSIFLKLELGEEQDVSRRVAAVLVYLARDDQRP